MNTTSPLKQAREAYGIVVDRDDPMKLGRVRVRVLGIHAALNIADDVIGIRNDELPWYPVLMPATNSSISGKGWSGGGIIPGTKVLMRFTDEFARDGYVAGSLATAPSSLANTTSPNGFQDPSGMYPTRTGVSTNNSTSMDLGAAGTLPVQVRDMNLSIAIQPDGSVAGAAPVDDNPDYSLQNVLKFEEGYRPQAYWDVKGYSIGIGHFIGEMAKSDYEKASRLLSKQIGRELAYHPGALPVITDPEITKLFEEDIQQVVNECNSPRFPRVFAAMKAAGNNKPRQWMLLCMAYQMGTYGLEQFSSTLTLFAQGKWAEGAKQARLSRWATQTPGRAMRVTYCLGTGNLMAYGVNPEKKEGKAVGADIVQRSSANPWDPAPEDDSAVMWEEDEYAGTPDYNYNKVYESESGHMTEIDDTPGNERLRWQHGVSNNYVEWLGSGNRNSKVYGNSKEAIEGNNFLKTGGNKKENVMGNNTLYVVGNNYITVDGNGVLHILGDSSVSVDGNQDVTIRGKSNITIIGDSVVNCQSNADINVEGNATTKVNGDMNTEVAGNYSLKVGGNISETASGNVKIDGSRIDLG